MSDMHTSNQEKSGFTAGMLLGLIFGGALGYFLSTPKGKEILEDIKEITQDSLNDIKQNINDNDMIQDRVDQIKTVMSQIQDVIETHQSHHTQQTTNPTPAPNQKPKPKLFQRAGIPLKPTIPN